MNKEVILKQYEELKRNRYVIESIEPDFFFEIVDCLLKDNELAKQALINNCDIADERNQLLKENEYKAEKIENQKNELAILNEKQKDFNKLQNTLNSYKGQFKRQEKDTHKLQNDLDIANAKIIELEKKIEDLKDFRKKFVDITDKELKEADDYFMYKYTFMGDELAQHLNTLLKVANNSVPIQKVRDKIEEKDKAYRKILCKNGMSADKFDRLNKLEIEVEVLQELVEEREEFPGIETLNYNYESYKAKVNRNVEGFVIAQNNNVSKYVRMKNGQLQAHHE